MNAARAAIAIKKHEVELARPSSAPLVNKEISEMLMYEELSRARIQELRAVARAGRTGGRDGAAVRLRRAIGRARLLRHRG
jgi:hypothetical protein